MLCVFLKETLSIKEKGFTPMEKCIFFRKKRFGLTFGLFLLISFLTYGCGTEADGHPNFLEHNSSENLEKSRHLEIRQEISIDPATVTLAPRESLLFEAKVKGGSKKRIFWSVQEGAEGGSITGEGIYTAPSKAGIYHIVAASLTDLTKKGAATVIVQGGPDTTPPTWPAGSVLAASRIDLTARRLDWMPAVDDVGVVNYRIYEGNVLLATVAAAVSTYDILAPAAGTTYTFKVEAGDAAGNWSSDGPSVTVITPKTERLSVSTTGIPGNGHSNLPSISADSRYVAFESLAGNLVADDTNNAKDVFVHDRLTGETTRVSVGLNGTQGNGMSYNAAISADGRYVVFQSSADNLVAGDTALWMDVFLHDRQTGRTMRVGVGPNGAEGNGPSHNPAISSDGRYIAFQSEANNLVVGDTNAAMDVFVYDQMVGGTTRVSVGSGGTEGKGFSYNPSLSADGRYVVFQSEADSLVVGDTNVAMDTFVHDRMTGETTRVSVGPNGAEGNGPSYNPAISEDGRYVAFQSDADNLVISDTNMQMDVFVHDRQTGQTQRVSVGVSGTEGNGISYNPAVSADGRYVAFESKADNLVADDTNLRRDVFVFDHQTGAIERLSVTSDGIQGDDDSRNPIVSADGRYVAFSSCAGNLVVDDAKIPDDVYIRDRGTP